METFCPVRSFVVDPDYQAQRRKTLKQLDINSIDAPLIKLTNGFSELNLCYTLQCCFGHFLHTTQRDRHSLAPLPPQKVSGKIIYRIAYMAFCIQNSPQGRALQAALARAVSIDHDYIQFGCAEWFWQRHPNSFVLQVEPTRYQHLDRIEIDDREARHIEQVRGLFFEYLERLLITISE